MNVPFIDIKEQFRELKSGILHRFSDVLSDCAFVNGKYVMEFEQKAAEFLGVKHAIGCGNGTDALVLALRACGVGLGDEVITTPFTFFATAEAIASVGAIPVFVDIKETDYTIDPQKIEEAITPKTKAIMPVHIFGACCEMDRIMAIAKKHGMRVIEDAAQAFGSTYKGKAAGSLADVGCFSFYPTKNLGGAGDGGICTTNDDELAVIIRALKEHGAGKNGYAAACLLGESIDNDIVDEASSEYYDPHKYYNYLIGYNSRLDALQACVLLEKMPYIQSYNATRKVIADRYSAGLEGVVELPKPDPRGDSCWHQYAIRTKRKEKLCKHLGEHGIGSGTFYPVPLHKQKAFNSRNCKNTCAELPVAEKVCSETVCLPIYPGLSTAQVEYVIDSVRTFFEVV